MKRFTFKTLLLLATGICLCGAAHGQYRESETVMDRLIWDDEKLNILLDTRFDAQFTTGNSDGRELGFKDQMLRVWLAGEIVPGIRFRLRQRLNKPLTALRDNLSAATDHAWIAFDVGRDKRWTITAGKQSVNFGTFEYDYNGADVYLSTMINSDLDSYKTGVDVAYRFGKQALHLQVVNSDATQFARDDYKNKALGATVLWEGNIGDGLVKTRWAYSAFQHTKSRFYNWITTGIEANPGKFTAQLDYYFGERNMDYGSVVYSDDSSLSFVHDQSAALNLEYNAGKWRPAVKGTFNRRHNMDLHRTAYDNWGIQAALEFYPFTAKYLKDLRFHFAYWYTDTLFRGPYAHLPHHDGHTVLAGMRWLFKAK
ncbi:MAG: OprO/OprP family phosphate-selective porin [Alistipes sp.]|nr:OprO/OprP family phosphate-selective porin [Alistipes sp.]